MIFWTSLGHLIGFVDRKMPLQAHRPTPHLESSEQ